MEITDLAQQFTKYYLGPLVPKTLSGIHEVKTIFIIHRHYLPYSLCWHLHRGCKSSGQKKKLLAPEHKLRQRHQTALYTVPPCIYSKKKMSVLLKNVLDESVRIINFINLLFILLCHIQLYFCIFCMMKWKVGITVL